MARDDLADARRFAKEAGHYPIVEYLDRWRNMEMTDKNNLFAKWKKEDEQVEKKREG